jgi:hypothetical protein
VSGGESAAADASPAKDNVTAMRPVTTLEDDMIGLMRLLRYQTLDLPATY